MATSQPVVRRQIAGITLPRVGEQGLVLILIAAGLLVIARTLPIYPALTQFRGESLRALPDVLAPLVVLALFIERAVEVVLAGWRAAESQRLETELERTFVKGSVQQQWQIRQRLDAFTSATKRWAFAIAFVISLLVSMMGVRAIEMLVEPNAVSDIGRSQQSLFVWVDIFVTALLLTGGAEGIHKVVNAFTTFIDSTKERIAPGASSAGAAIPSSEGRDEDEASATTSTASAP